MGKQFDKLLNVTLCYPDNNRQPFFDMLSGKLTRIVVHVDLQPIADELHGDYINDKSFKRHFKQWLNSLWQEKDRLLTTDAAFAGIGQISPLAQCRIENAFIVGIKHDFPIPPILTYSHFLSVTLHVNATFDARARRIKPLQMNGFIWHSQCFYLLIENNVLFFR